jgi:preprotein translocase SecE subunit
MEAYKPGQGSLARLSAWLILLLVATMGVVELYSWIHDKGDRALVGLRLFEDIPILGVPFSWKFVLCVALLVGMLWLVRWYMARPVTVDLLIETELEMKKVSWPTMDEAMNATWVVVLVTVVLTGSLFFFVYVLTALFSWIF